MLFSTMKQIKLFIVTNLTASMTLNMRWESWIITETIDMSMISLWYRTINTNTDSLYSFNSWLNIRLDLAQTSHTFTRWSLRRCVFKEDIEEKETRYSFMYSFSFSLSTGIKGEQIGHSKSNKLRNHFSIALESKYTWYFELYSKWYSSNRSEYVFFGKIVKTTEFKGA